MRKIGWENDGKWHFCFSDCVLHEKCVQIEGEESVFSLGFTEHILEGENGRKTDLLQLIGVLQKAPEILYPIFISNISALLYPIWEHEEQGSVLWLCGESGSGKTELAMTLGTYVDREKRRSQSKSLFSANAKTRNMIQTFRLHRGINFVLDDVKKERVPGQKNKLSDNVDTVIRSVFAQRLTDNYALADYEQDDAIRAGAIITGEIIDIQESTKARILFLPVADFINTQEGSAAISSLQRHPEWLVGTMAGIIQYLCHEWNADGGTKRYMDSFEMLAEQEKDSFRGKQTARLARTCALQRLSHDIFMGYASMMNCSCDMQFVHLKKLVCNVESMLYSMTEVLSEALEQVLSEMKVQRAKLYFEDYEDFERKRQCLQYGLLLKPEYDALYFANMKEIPDIYCEKRRLLLVKREEFLQKLRKIIIEIMEKRKLTNNAFLRALSTHLREQQIILTQGRSDRYCNNAAMYRLYEESMFAGVDPIKDCSCFVLNIENARIAQILQLEDQDMEQILLEDLENKREAKRICNAGEWHHSEANAALREICRSYF